MATNRDDIERQYGTSANLTARQSIYRYVAGGDNFYAWVLGHVTWRGDERVFDIGCGNGSYPAHLAGNGHRGLLIGGDLSAGMLREAREASPVRVVVADAQHVPLRSASVDVGLAMHMLYHVPDIAAAVAELRRVVRAGGIVLVVTNGAAHFAELNREFEAAIGGGGDPVMRSSSRFNLDNGEAVLRAHFDDVTLDERRVIVRVPDRQAMLDYTESTRSLREPALPERVWDDTMRRLGARLQERIDRDGVFEITSHVGAWVCR